MTLAQFLEEFNKLKSYGFKPFFTQLLGKKIIRLKFGSDCFCPITAVYFSRYKIHESSCYFREVGTKLGLTEEDIVAIVDAADGQDNPSLQSRLMEALS